MLDGLPVSPKARPPSVMTRTTPLKSPSASALYILVTLKGFCNDLEEPFELVTFVTWCPRPVTRTTFNTDHTSILESQLAVHPTQSVKSRRSRAARSTSHHNTNSLLNWW